MRLLLFLVFIYSSHAKCQEKPTCNTIIFNDSLFVQQTDDFDYCGSECSDQVHVHPNTDVNDVMTLKNGYLNFLIKYQCHQAKVQLVSNGKVEEDSLGRPYIILKLLVRGTGFCKTIYTDHQCWSTKGIKAEYIKFEGLDDLLKNN